MPGEPYTIPYNSSQLAPSDERDVQLEEIRHEDEQRALREEEDDDEDGDYRSSQATRGSDDDYAEGSDFDHADGSSDEDSTPPLRNSKVANLHSHKTGDESFHPDNQETEDEEDEDED